MKTNKSKGILLTAAAAALSITMFSVLFIGANTFAFATATNKTESLPPAAATVGIPQKSVPPEDYRQPELTVYMSSEQHFDVGANAIFPEEAAELGALYIWDMFGESIDGMAVEMYYSAWPSHTKAYWHGTVAASKTDLDTAMPNNYNPLYRFTICSISGERIDISDYRKTDFGNDFGNDRVLYKDIPDALRAISDDESVRTDAMRKPSDIHSPELLEECAKAAADFAAKHFVNTEVTSVELKDEPSVTFESDKNGNTIIAPDRRLRFTVTDSTGREADIAIIVAEIKKLSYIITQHNDIVPGYSYEGDTPGLG